MSWINIFKNKKNLSSEITSGLLFNQGDRSSPFLVLPETDSSSSCEGTEPPRLSFSVDVSSYISFCTSNNWHRDWDLRWVIFRTMVPNHGREEGKQPITRPVDFCIKPRPLLLHIKVRNSTKSECSLAITPSFSFPLSSSPQHRFVSQELTCDLNLFWKMGCITPRNMGFDSMLSWSLRSLWESGNTRCFRNVAQSLIILQALSYYYKTSEQGRGGVSL